MPNDLFTFLLRHQTLSIALALVLVFLIILEIFRAKGRPFQISPRETINRINHENAVVIDVRNQDSFKKGHIIDAILISSEEIKSSPKKLDKYKKRPIILVCATGLESPKLAALLLKQGYNAYSLTGGLRAWREADLPLIKES